MTPLDRLAPFYRCSLRTHTYHTWPRRSSTAPSHARREPQRKVQQERDWEWGTFAETSCRRKSVANDALRWMELHEWNTTLHLRMTVATSPATGRRLCVMCLTHTSPFFTDTPKHTELSITVFHSVWTILFQSNISFKIILSTHIQQFQYSYVHIFTMYDVHSIYRKVTTPVPVTSLPVYCTWHRFDCKTCHVCHRLSALYSHIRGFRSMATRYLIQAVRIIGPHEHCTQCFLRVFWVPSMLLASCTRGSP